MTVSETVADQCMNAKNYLEALTRSLKLVLTRLTGTGESSKSASVSGRGPLRQKFALSSLAPLIPGSLRADASGIQRRSVM